MTQLTKSISLFFFTCISLASVHAAAQTPLPEPAPAPAPAQPAQPVQPAQPPPNVVVVQPAPVQPAPAPAQPQPTVYVYEMPPPPSYAYVPPPPPKTKKEKKHGVYTHDGFYLRMGIGVGAVVLGNAGADDDTTLSTGGAAIEFGMGGTVGNGFVIGGRLMGVGGQSLELESPEGSTNVPGGLTYSTVQLFADWYVDPESGLHIEGALGPVGLSYDPTVGEDDDYRNDDDETIDGFGGSLGVGWEGWIGEQWSLGGMFRLNWATFAGDVSASSDDRVLNSTAFGDGDTGRIIAVAPMLMLTGTFH